jgi:hypothetical protein
MKEHFIHFFPFLNKPFRQLDKKELNSQKTFSELFPNEDFDASKLKAIFEFQKGQKKNEVQKSK